MLYKLFICSNTPPSGRWNMKWSRSWKSLRFIHINWISIAVSAWIILALPSFVIKMNVNPEYVTDILIYLYIAFTTRQLCATTGSPIGSWDESAGLQTVIAEDIFQSKPRIKYSVLDGTSLLCNVASLRHTRAFWRSIAVHTSSVIWTEQHFISMLA